MRSGTRRTPPTGGREPPTPPPMHTCCRPPTPRSRAADPSATVVLGGLTGNDYSFLEGVYQAGGKGSFDAVGVHTDTACNILSPYEFLRGSDNRLIPDSFLAYREVRATMLANGDDKPIWMTELSWRTTGRDLLRRRLGGPEGGRRHRAAAGHLPEPGIPLPRGGPLRAGGPVVPRSRTKARSSPAWFGPTARTSPPSRRCAPTCAHGDRLTGPCGVFTGPRITVASPTNRRRLHGPALDPRVGPKPAGRVPHPAASGRAADPQLRRARPTRASLSGWLTWQGAKHIAFGWHTLSFTGLRQGAQRLGKDSHDLSRQGQGPASPSWPQALTGARLPGRCNLRRRARPPSPTRRPDRDRARRPRG